MTVKIPVFGVKDVV